MDREEDGSERSEAVVNMIKTHCVKLLGTKEKGHSKNSSDKQMARKKKLG